MLNSKTLDNYFLRETLRLAKKGEGWVNPNPMVGAVIVKNRKVIARGYHHRAGQPHAEIEALRAAKTSVKGATLYVNLEPCCHFGKTPPCIDAIIKSGIKRVVFSTLDPNPKVSGKSAKILRKTGIKISKGLLTAEARRLNEALFIFYEKHRPFVALKFAASLDGKIAARTGDAKWITNEQARHSTRSLRGKYQGVLVGAGTVLADDPHLGTRIAGKRNPLRIVLDTTLKIPLTSQVLRDDNVAVITTTVANQKNARHRKARELMLLPCPGRESLYQNLWTSYIGGR